MSEIYTTDNKHYTVRMYRVGQEGNTEFEFQYYRVMDRFTPSSVTVTSPSGSDFYNEYQLQMFRTRYVGMLDMATEDLMHAFYQGAVRCGRSMAKAQGMTRSYPHWPRGYPGRISTPG